MTFRFETANERWKWFNRIGAGEFDIGPQDSEGYFSPEEIGASLENIYQEAQNNFDILKQQMFRNSGLLSEKSDDLEMTMLRSADLEQELEGDGEGDIEWSLESLNEQMAKDPQWAKDLNNEPYTIENSTLQPRHWVEIANTVLNNAQHIKALIDDWLPPQDQTVLWPQGFGAEIMNAQEAKYQLSYGLGFLIDFCEKVLENEGIPQTVQGVNKDNFFNYVNSVSDLLRIFPVVNTEFKIVDKNGNEIGGENV